MLFKRKRTKNKQWSTKHDTETKYWATQTPQKYGVNSRVPNVYAVPAPKVV